MKVKVNKKNIVATKIKIIALVKNNLSKIKYNKIKIHKC